MPKHARDSVHYLYNTAGRKLEEPSEIQFEAVDFYKGPLGSVYASVHCPTMEDISSRMGKTLRFWTARLFGKKFRPPPSRWMVVKARHRMVTPRTSSGIVGANFIAATKDFFSTAFMQ